MKEKSMETLIKCCHHLTVNMNDTFHYACADNSELNAEDALDLLPFIESHGFDALIAYEAIKRGYDPDIKDYVTPEFLEIKEVLLHKMKEDADFLCDLNFKKREEGKQIAEFGGILSFKFEKPSYLKRLLGQSYYTCICSCENRKTKGYGKNMKEAREDLVKRLTKEGSYGN